eukprot:CAMPEP_0167780352 /NCGR_PEP_ID=MMETSP0111_2-20121227/5304_1 /TAXON_ID=91324 /ORGANISM="Lotharella globosa, Strain CCCM811" /LENGTH=56 /DNA_ID=CAMNT_0007670843 /DNA_START=66 /DNA_END=236 /DNA_ORIENTATION=-
MTLILVVHDVLNVARLVDHVFVMDQGRCVHQGSHEELVKRRAPEYMRLLGDDDGKA